MDVKEVEEQKKEQMIKQNAQHNYLIDNSISDFERFVRYVNESEGYEFINVQKLTELLSEEI